MAHNNKRKKKKQLPRLSLYGYPFKSLSMNEREFLQLAESTHYTRCQGISDDDFHYAIRESVKYLVYTEFVYNGKNPSQSLCSVTFVYGRQLLSRIQTILYHELYEQRHYISYPFYFAHLLSTFRKEFFERVTKIHVNLYEIRMDAINEMKNDLNKIVAENSISRKYLIECLTEYGLVGDDIANIIADFLSAQYPFLCHPPPNPYYYDNSLRNSHFGRLDQTTLKRLKWPRRRSLSRSRLCFQIVEGNSKEVIHPSNWGHYREEFLNVPARDDDVVGNECLRLFHVSKSQEYFWSRHNYTADKYHRYHQDEDEPKIHYKTIGSVQQKGVVDGKLTFFYSEVYGEHAERYCVTLSKSWTDLWNFIRNDGIKIDCYSGLYFANTDAM